MWWWCATCKHLILSCRCVFWAGGSRLVVWIGWSGTLGPATSRGVGWDTLGHMGRRSCDEAVIDFCHALITRNIYIYTYIHVYVIYYNIFSKGQMKRSILNQGFCFFCVFNASGKGLTHFRKDQLRHWRFDPQKPWEDQLHLAPWAGRQRWHLESTSEQGAVRFRFYEMVSQIGNAIPIESMYGIYANIYHQYTPNVSIYTIHGSYGIGIKYSHADANWTNTGTCWDCWTNNWKIVPCWQSHRHKKITEMRSYKDIIP